MQKPLSVMKSHLLIVDPSACVNSVLFRKFISCANEVKTVPQFLLYQSQFIWLYGQVFDPFWFKLGMWWWMWIYLYFSVFCHPVCLTFIGEDAAFFSQCTFDLFIKNQVPIGVWIYFWFVHWISLINESVLSQSNTLSSFLLLFRHTTTWNQGWWYTQQFFYY